MAIGDIIVGLDVGASKVSCVIGQVNKFNEIEVIGHGLSKNANVKKGQILDLQATAKSIMRAIQSAEEISELSVNSAYVNIKGMNVRIEKMVIESDVEKPDDGMTVKDLYEAYSKIQLATRLEEGEQIIDIIPNQYEVNGRIYKDEPIGAFCRTFKIEAEVVIAQGEYIAQIQKVLSMAGLKLDGLILETLATSNIVLMPEEKEMGVMLIDMGAAHTDISLYKDSKLEFYTTLPVGGDHITNDIALTLGINHEESEKLKKQYNLAIKAMITNDHDIKLNTKEAADEKDTIIKCSDIVSIIEARVKEVFQIIKKISIDNGLTNRFDCVVLTGQGISNIIGTEELAMLMLKRKQVRICSPKLINIIKPQHTTVFGMVRYIATLGLSKHVSSDVEIITELGVKERMIDKFANIGTKFKNIFKKVKDNDDVE